MKTLSTPACPPQLWHPQPPQKLSRLSFNFTWVCRFFQSRWDLGSRWNEWGEGWLHSSQSFCISAATSIQLFDSAHIWLRTCGRDSAEEAQEDKFVLPYLDKVLNYKIAITSTQCCNLNITVLNQFLSPWDPESRPTTLGTCTFPSLLTVTTWKLSHFLLFCVHVCVFLPCFLISL